MKAYDAMIIGGGISGSVCAKFSSMGGVKTLFVEKHRTPRHKACSGIQMDYFSRIIGEKFPRVKL